MGYLTEEQLQFYDTNGYLVMDLLDANEAQKLGDAYTEMFDSKKDNFNLESTWEGSWKAEKNTVMKIVPQNQTWKK